MSDALAVAIALAEKGRGLTHPNPVVGAVVVGRDGSIVGQGWHERAGGPHAEVVALRQAGERARGATLYVSLEPCSTQGRTPPCTEAILTAGVARVVAAAADPVQNGLGLLDEAGVEVELADSWEARVQNEAWRTWAALGRPFVTYKAAVTLDGRMTVAGSRWVSGEESRRLVHELRAASDAVAVGMGTVRADNPALTARDVGAVRQPRRLAFGRGPLPEGSQLELVSGPLDEALRRLGEQEVQSLLLEGGSTLATAFLEADLIDKLLVFVAPLLSGEGPRLFRDLATPVDVLHFSARAVGKDVLLTGYLHEP